MSAHRILLLAACFLMPALAQADEPKAAAPAEPPQALKRLGQLVGGVWTSPGTHDGLVKEFRYEWIMGGKVLKGTGVIGIGSAKPTPVEAFMGWDPARKEVYYLDLHGPNMVFKGSVKLEGEKLNFEFDTVVGPKGSYRTEEEFADPDTLRFTIFVKQGEGWKEVGKQELKRRK